MAVSLGTSAAASKALEKAGTQMTEQTFKSIKEMSKAKLAGSAEFKNSHTLKIDSNQFGRKVGKHASDFGLDPSLDSSRQKIYRYINEIFQKHDEVRKGTWRGLGEILPDGNKAPGEALFYIKGYDVLVTDLNNNFITLLKDGIHNSRVINAMN